MIKTARKDYICNICGLLINKGTKYTYYRYTKRNFYDDYETGEHYKEKSTRETHREHNYNCAINSNCRQGKHNMIVYRYIDLFSEDNAYKARDGQMICINCSYFEDEFYKIREDNINLYIDL